MSSFFSVVFVADPRFPGGSSTALMAEISACRAAGLATAILPISGPTLRKGWPIHPDIGAALARGDTVLIPPGTSVHARFAIVHHPMVLSDLAHVRLGLRADHAVLVLHHPVLDPAGAQEYPLLDIVQTVADSLGILPAVAPVGPKVRAQLPIAQLSQIGARVPEQDWHNLIDIRAWPDLSTRDRTPGTPWWIGRHSRPHPPKFPDTLGEALYAYPDMPGFRVSAMGVPEDGLIRRYGQIPAHWSCLPFNAMPVHEYLSTLDFYVYFHGSDWIEAFGRAPLEAAACGLPVILPPNFQPLFGPAAVYCNPSEVRDVLAELAAAPEARALQGRNARAHVAKAFGLGNYVARLDRLDPDWASIRRAQPTATFPMRPSPVPRTVMMMTSNGVGLGHLTRLLAIADTLPSDLEPVFFTLSKGVGLATDAGYRAEYRPFHRDTGVSTTAWNSALSVDLCEAMSYYGAGTFVFDGNMPYNGVLDALATLPDRKSIWVRRGFWTDAHADAILRQDHFDALIEPRDMADAYDVGPTTQHRQNAHLVSPIIRGTPGQLLPRAEAKARLGLDPTARHVLFSLGSASNFDTSDLCAHLFDLLAGELDLRVAVLRSPLATDVIQSRPHFDVISAYPIFPCLNAFDFAISACGYNTFHEHLAARLPTIFVPNEAAEMDQQIIRARFAEVAGFGRLLRRADRFAAAPILRDMVTPGALASMAGSAARYPFLNGAQQASDFISHYDHLRKLARKTA